MRLARMLGRVDVDEMLEEMTPTQFDEWYAYSRIEPFDNGWEQAGTIASTVYNVVMTALFANAGKSIQIENLMSVADFVPAIKPKKKVKRNDGSVAAFEARIEQQARRWQPTET